MESQKAGILETYFAVCQKYEKPYCFQSQKYTLVLLEKYHKITISLRTLNRRLRELEDSGFISRVRRHRAGDHGKIVFNSTLSKLRARAFDWFSRRLMGAARVFSFFRVPKTALYRFKTARYPSPVDSLAGLIARHIQKGTPTATVF